MQDMTQRILIVDDDPGLLAGIRRSLGRRYDLECVESAKRALELIRQGKQFAVILTDMRMPEMDGIELLKRVQQLSPETVRLMLTGNIDQQTAVDALNQGRVVQFLTKPCHSDTIAAAFDEGLKIHTQQHKRKTHQQQQIAEIEKLNNKLAYQTHFDPLTGLANRQSFHHSLDSALQSARQEQRQHTLGFLDLDHFHLINDNCGFAAGDQLLRHIGQILAAYFHNGDQVSRLSGNSFGFLLIDSPFSEAEARAHELHDLFTRQPFRCEGRQFNIALCIGLIPVNQASESASRLLAMAETACHVAKDSGRNRIHVSSPQDSELTSRLNDAEWVSRIEQALHGEQFLLYQQTIVPSMTRTDQTSHFEVLLRMKGEDSQIIPPDSFLNVAESFNLSPQIDRWVIEHCFHWLAAHPDILQRLGHCAINLSGLSIGDNGLFDFIQACARESAIPAEKICFEVTETAAIAQFQLASEWIEALREIGFRFSLDDFGTGLSSFAYLKNLPVDFLKIDGSFVRNLHRDLVDRAMVQSINEIGHTMGKQTIAERVENEAIAQILRGIGVDYLQGYLFAKPAPIEQLA